MGMLTRAEIADELHAGREVTRYPGGRDLSGARRRRNGWSAPRWPVGGGRSRLTVGDRDRAGGRNGCERSPRRRRRPSGRPARGGDAVGPTGGQGLVERFTKPAAERVEVPLTRQTGSARWRCGPPSAAAADVQRSTGWSSPRSTAVHRFMGAAARRPCPRPACWWPPSGRPRPTRCACRAWSPTWCRPSTGRRGLVEAFPDPGPPGDRVLFPCADLAPSTHRRWVWAKRAGRWSGSRPTGPCRCRRPIPRCWTGWPRPTP